MTGPDLAELRRLLDGGTPTPWVLTGLTVWAWGNGRVVMGPAPQPFPATFDLELIAAAVNALPALLDAAAERDALAAKVERVRTALRIEAADYGRGYLVAGEVLRALDEEPQP